MMENEEQTEREIIEALRQELTDYYGTAMQEYPMALMDMERIQTMNDAAILEEAKKTGLI